MSGSRTIKACPGAARQQAACTSAPRERPPCGCCFPDGAIYSLPTHVVCGGASADDQLLVDLCTFGDSILPYGFAVRAGGTMARVADFNGAAPAVVVEQQNGLAAINLGDAEDDRPQAERCSACTFAGGGFTLTPATGLYRLRLRRNATFGGFGAAMQVALVCEPIAGLAPSLAAGRAAELSATYLCAGGAAGLARQATLVMPVLFKAAGATAATLSYSGVVTTNRGNSAGVTNPGANVNAAYIRAYRFDGAAWVLAANTPIAVSPPGADGCGQSVFSGALRTAWASLGSGAAYLLVLALVRPLFRRAATGEWYGGTGRIACVIDGVSEEL